MSDNSRNILLYLLKLLETRPIFPKIYDGFIEVDELSKAEDYLIDLLRNCVEFCASDKFVSLMNEQKLSAWESELGLSSSGLSLDERRTQMIEYLGRSRAITDDSVLEKANLAAGVNDLDVITDYNQLKILVLKPLNGDDTDAYIHIAKALKALLPYIPQNLYLRGGVRASFDQDLTSYHGALTSLGCHLGHVEYFSTDVIIGVSNTVNDGTIALGTYFYWAYGFTNGSISNLWSPNYYANGILPSGTGSGEYVPGENYEKVIFKGNEGNTFDMSDYSGAASFYIGTYSNKPEFYTQNLEGTAGNGENSALIVEPVEGSTVLERKIYALPTDLYTINGTSIRWNTSHPLYSLLYGRNAEPFTPDLIVYYMKADKSEGSVTFNPISSAYNKYDVFDRYGNRVQYSEASKLQGATILGYINSYNMDVDNPTSFPLSALWQTYESSSPTGYLRIGVKCGSSGSFTVQAVALVFEKY